MNSTIVDRVQIIPGDEETTTQFSLLMFGLLGYFHKQIESNSILAKIYDQVATITYPSFLFLISSRHFVRRLDYIGSVCTTHPI